MCGGREVSVCGHGLRGVCGLRAVEECVWAGEWLSGQDSHTLSPSVPP